MGRVLEKGCFSKVDLFPVLSAARYAVSGPNKAHMDTISKLSKTRRGRPR